MHQIDVEIAWDCELGTVTRRAFGNGEGPLRCSAISRTTTRTTRIVAGWSTFGFGLGSTAFHERPVDDVLVDIDTKAVRNLLRGMMQIDNALFRRLISMIA